MAAGRQQPTYRRADAPQSPVIWIVGILVLLIMGMIVFLFLGNARGSDVPPDDGTIADGAAPSEQRVSFVAVGDNLPDITLASYADACAGVPDDGLYDYNPLYRPIKPYIEAADLAYIDFETHAGGNDIGPRGYPSFNTTDTMVDAVYDTGFDLIASATNHCYDWGQSALDHSRALWMQKPVLFAGTASTPEEAAVIPTREKNGIVFSFLNYTYGVNGYQEEDIPSWAVNYMHEDRIREDVARARESSDVVIVAMHWGTENLTEADENQRSYAQILADSGADLVLGSHPHVIGPVEWVEGSQGNKTLVAYSLGNFISHHETPDYLNELEGMLQCEFVKDQGTVRIENVAWVPLVNHSEEGAYAVYPLKDY
ncbi:MAG: CapA family protein, partial [Coriobacteriaceae bacterium]|nr:CapA family protein [Coriobacteriaceae bacterium]